MKEYWKLDFNTKAVLRSKGELSINPIVRPGYKKKKSKKGPKAPSLLNIWCCGKRESYPGINGKRYCKTCARGVG